jgi:hypothetical protein
MEWKDGTLASVLGQKKVNFERLAFRLVEAAG